jgi:hypothetical protein
MMLGLTCLVCLRSNLLRHPGMTLSPWVGVNV